MLLSVDFPLWSQGYMCFLLLALMMSWIVASAIALVVLWSSSSFLVLILLSGVVVTDGSYSRRISVVEVFVIVLTLCCIF